MTMRIVRSTCAGTPTDRSTAPRALIRPKSRGLMTGRRTGRSGVSVGGTGSQLVLVSAMWAAMMVGMMVPSATPMVVAYTDWTRRDPTSGSRLGAVASLLSGYVLVWLGFSLLAAILQMSSNMPGD